MLSCLDAGPSFGDNMEKFFIRKTHRNVQNKMLEDIPNMHQEYCGSMCQVGDGSEFVVRNSINQELGLIRFQASEIQDTTPLAFELIIPEDSSEMMSSPSDYCQLTEAWSCQQETHSAREGFFDKCSSGYGYQSVVTAEEETSQCLRLTTEKPRYNSEYGCWMINFSGRATNPSQANFILGYRPQDNNLGFQCESADGCWGGGRGDERFVMLHYKKRGQIGDSRDIDCFDIEVRDPLCAQLALGLSAAARAIKTPEYVYDGKTY